MSTVASVLTPHFLCLRLPSQAVNRIHRLGQTRAIKIIKMVAQGTVEERVLQLRAERKASAAAAGDSAEAAAVAAAEAKQRRPKHRSGRGGAAAGAAMVAPMTNYDAQRERVTT